MAVSFDIHNKQIVRRIIEEDYGLGRCCGSGISLCLILFCSSVRAINSKRVKFDFFFHFFYFDFISPLSLAPSSPLLPPQLTGRNLSVLLVEQTRCGFICVTACLFAVFFVHLQNILATEMNIIPKHCLISFGKKQV